MKEVDFISKAKVKVLPPKYFTYPPAPASSSFWDALKNAFGSIGGAIATIVGVGILAVGGLGLAILHGMGALSGLSKGLGSCFSCPSCKSCKEACEACVACMCCAGTAVASYKVSQVIDGGENPREPSAIPETIVVSNPVRRRSFQQEDEEEKEFEEISPSPSSVCSPQKVRNPLHLATKSASEMDKRSSSKK